MDVEKIISDLIGPTESRKEKAICELLANSDAIRDVCVRLIETLKILNSDSGNSKWEVKCRIVEALGLLKCEDSRNILLSIINTDIEHDLVKTYASTAFFRIFRKDPNDVSPIWLLAEGTYSVREGALNALGYDRMVPNEPDCKKIISEFWSFGNDRPRGLGDPRYGLAAAMAGWPLELCELFLLDCLKSDDAPLNYVAKNALRGKYVTLR